MITSNVMLNTDSYKASHWVQYPPNTDYVYSYIESRGGKFDKTVFFGLQMFIRDYLMNPITLVELEEAKEFWAAHGEPFNEEGWRYIIEKHRGYLPVLIKAVPEGSVVPTHNVLATIVNTDPKCYWLPSYLETALLRAVWYPTTVATISWHCKQIIKEAIGRTSDVPEQIDFKLHDFGARGVSSHESAAIGGAAHLVNFMGTDTVAGVLAVRRYYSEKMAGFSIPAAEHSTMTSWGREREVDAYRNMLQQFGGPGKLVAVVSDSYDIYNAASNIWGGVLKDEVLASGSTIVVRPDSGDPLMVPIEIIQALGEKFGYTVNSKGYKVLPSAVRVIQGDGITVDSLPVIIKNLESAGWAIDNLAFGMGGGLLQHVNRDTQKFAMKVSSAMVDGKWIDVYKDPVGDHSKMSKKGRITLWESGGEYTTSVDKPTKWTDKGCEWKDSLKVVLKDGCFYNKLTFSQVRDNAKSS